MTTDRVWEFFVPGRPYPKGSLVAIPRKGATPIRSGGDTYWRLMDLFMREQIGANLKRWMAAVQWAAREAGAPRKPLDGPWRVEMTFWFLRPKRPMDDEWAIGADAKGKLCGDADKLTRAVLDALEGIFWTNDRRVADPHAPKKYGEREGLEIRVEYLGTIDQQEQLPALDFR